MNLCVCLPLPPFGVLLKVRVCGQERVAGGRQHCEGYHEHGAGADGQGGGRSKGVMLRLWGWMCSFRCMLFKSGCLCRV